MLVWTCPCGEFKEVGNVTVTELWRAKRQWDAEHSAHGGRVDWWTMEMDELRQEIASYESEREYAIQLFEKWASRGFGDVLREVLLLMKTPKVPIG